MTVEDEPQLKRADPPAPSETRVEARIRRLLARQHFAVLCTEGEGQPYGSVVALAVDGTLCTAVFATGRSTRKYRLLSANPRVAFVVDDRDRHPDELMTVEAVTVTGRAREVNAQGDDPPEAALLLEKHPNLRSFVGAPTTAVFAIDIIRYLHVWKFQEVRQWVPPPPA